MFQVLRERNFALLWYGQLISLAGDWVLLIALPFHVYALTGSALATGAMFIAYALPGMLLGSFAGVYADRWDRKRMMVFADVIRAAMLLPILLVRSPDMVWLVYVVGFCEAVVGQFFFPAKNAVIPLLAGERDLVAANALNSVSESVTRLVGPSLGGLLLAWGGITTVVLVDAVSFLVSALLIVLIAMPTQPAKEESGAKPQGLRGLWNDWRDGMRLVRNDRTLWALFVVIAMVGLADSAFTALLVVFTKDVMKVGAQELGILMGMQGVGGLVGGMLAARLTHRITPAAMVTAGCIGAGVGMLIIVNAANMLVAAVLLVAGGVLITSFTIGTFTIFQSTTADAFRGRVFGAVMTANALTRVLGLAISGMLADAVGAVPVLSVGALIWIVAGLSAWAMLPPAVPPKKQPVPVSAAE